MTLFVRPRRRSKRARPEGSDTGDHPGASGPSWFTLFAQAKDSLWSVDLFRGESILLGSHWVLVVIDVFTRRIIGFGIGGEYIGGPRLCRMFNQAIAGHKPPARHESRLCLRRPHGRAKLETLGRGTDERPFARDCADSTLPYNKFVPSGEPA